MKRVTLGSMLLAMTFSTTVLAAVAGPRWTGPVGDPEPFWERCTWDIFEPSEPRQRASAAVLERIDWSIECGVISARVRKRFFYEFDDDGNIVERPEVIYPMFTHTDSEGHLTLASKSVWKPDVTRDAEGHFANCAIPADVVWAGNCYPY